MKSRDKGCRLCYLELECAGDSIENVTQIVSGAHFIPVYEPEMECSYCRAWNAEDEPRCNRCGRRLAVAAAAYAVSHGALAAKALPDAAPPGREPERIVEPAPLPRDDRAPQRSLFPDRPELKVIPFARRGAATSIILANAPAAAAASKPPKRSAARRLPSPRDNAQPTLDFLSPAPQSPRTLKTSVQASIYCDSPVAGRTHRIVAASIDLGLIITGYAFLLSVFYLAGGSFELSKPNLLVFAGGGAAVGIFYGLLWIIAGRETPGRRWAHLQLTNFDGFQPEPRQRILRFFGTCLGVGALGMGLLWSLADEENLTWQDHISQTFPTYREPDTNFVRRG
jgi:uncharacterized RDD family membrane protein YckC